MWAWKRLCLAEKRPKPAMEWSVCVRRTTFCCSRASPTPAIREQQRPEHRGELQVGQSDVLLLQDANWFGLPGNVPSSQ